MGRYEARFVASTVVGLACMFLFAGSAAAQGGALVAAEYGAGDRRVDVTPQVRSFMHDGILQFDVNDQNLGVDPARNHVKELFIRIRHWDGNVEEFRFPEYSHVIWFSIPTGDTNGTIANCTSCAPSTAAPDISS